MLTAALLNTLCR